MGEAHYWRPGGKDLRGKPQRIRIILRHHKDPEGRYLPQHAICAPDPEKGRLASCGGAIVFYRTYPREARMPFDGPPVVVDETMLENGMVVATVETDNVHFATCASRQRSEPPPIDGKSRAIGG